MSIEKEPQEYNERKGSEEENKKPLSSSSHLAAAPTPDTTEVTFRHKYFCIRCGKANLGYGIDALCKGHMRNCHPGVFAKNDFGKFAKFIGVAFDKKGTQIIVPMERALGIVPNTESVIADVKKCYISHCDKDTTVSTTETAASTLASLSSAPSPPPRPTGEKEKTSVKKKEKMREITEDQSKQKKSTDIDGAEPPLKRSRYTPTSESSVSTSKKVATTPPSEKAQSSNKFKISHFSGKAVGFMVPFSATKVVPLFIAEKGALLTVELTGVRNFGRVNILEGDVRNTKSIEVPIVACGPISYTEKRITLQFTKDTETYAHVINIHFDGQTLVVPFYIAIFEDLTKEKIKRTISNIVWRKLTPHSLGRFFVDYEVLLRAVASFVPFHSEILSSARSFRDSNIVMVNTDQIRSLLHDTKESLHLMNNELWKMDFDKIMDTIFVINDILIASERLLRNNLLWFTNFDDTVKIVEKETSDKAVISIIRDETDPTKTDAFILLLFINDSRGLLVPVISERIVCDTKRFCEFLRSNKVGSLVDINHKVIPIAEVEGLMQKYTDGILRDIIGERAPVLIEKEPPTNVLPSIAEMPPITLPTPPFPSFVPPLISPSTLRHTTDSHTSRSVFIKFANGSTPLFRKFRIDEKTTYKNLCSHIFTVFDEIKEESSDAIMIRSGSETSDFYVMDDDGVRSLKSGEKLYVSLFV